jgi:PPK2 family polyphosphate:nucleotide phosphotransferase
MSASSLHRVKPGSRVNLARIKPSSTPGLEGPRDEERSRAEEELAAMLPRLAKLQYRLYAENSRAVLVVLQGMDTSGKDGVVRHVFSGLNPQGCHVTSFKKPSEAEADRDFLWRIHAAVPARGEIGVFNRAHYEDVLITRVHDFIPKKVWSRRYAMINDFERFLAENHVTILKFFLHISKEEQLERLQARLDDPEKNWKFALGDIEERKFWPAYQQAYRDAISNCSTDWAPWYVIPADRKWYRNWAIAKVLLETLEDMNPKIPKATIDVSKIKLV